MQLAPEAGLAGHQGPPCLLGLPVSPAPQLSPSGTLISHRSAVPGAGGAVAAAEPEPSFEPVGPVGRGGLYSDLPESQCGFPAVTAGWRQAAKGFTG